MKVEVVRKGVGVNLEPKEFEWISRFLYERTGISLSDGKQALVMGRLDKRLRANGLQSYSDYFALLGRPGYEAETTVAIDLLTTNETYFFREPKHFTFLEKNIIPQFASQRQIRVWSAASSSGEEAYTIAMTLAEHFPTKNWEVVGTDISTRVVEKAQRGLYPMLEAEKIPMSLLKKYCLKGKDEFEDFFLMDPAIKNQVHFSIANLVEPLPDLGMFEVIFLRNVMIYFDIQTKKNLVQRLYERLRPGGYFIVSHSETLNGLDTSLKLVAPAVYQKNSY
ncbi:protein-glutamate O-methyltransferase CheR [Undibacterium cyanobacteriorum]|uniref:Chemotaxis protein methyltransferase n=1 Tax=Undibacterium cyanobacteriorum TaxID=3073561 RepID=A0ABY9RGM1_9BURK|nr:protein-glutamate O-methyltransferase CheR [Undibacterium sp. 20NA77.5]WMW80377.1 protein-glutamate O-methyltransferase CheR [Undibacterium sp. 20NA77.5]